MRVAVESASSVCSVVLPLGLKSEMGSTERSLVAGAIAAESRDQGSGHFGAYTRHRFIDLLGSSLSHTVTLSFRPTRLCRKMNCNASSSDCARHLATERCAISRAVSTASGVGGRTIMRLYLASPLVPARSGPKMKGLSVS